MTGLAQIAGAASSEEALALDRTYAANWNPRLDCRLIALSFAVNVFGKSRVQGWQEAKRRREKGSCA